MRKFVLLCAALLLAGCATGYQPQTWTGGYKEIEIKENTWRVVFSGNGYVTSETVQTFWLYRCAEFTLSKGYDGFEIVSDTKLVSLPAAGIEGEPRLIPAQVPMLYKPYIAGTIRMLKGPITQKPPHIFDAVKLKARLQPLVKGKLCDGNVCPHFHGYLLPDV